MGRPTKLTTETQKRIVQALKLGSTHELACQYGGIKPSTFYRWMASGKLNRDPRKREFYDAVKEAEGAHALQALATIHRAAKDGDWKAGAWLLERRHGYTRDGSAGRVQQKSRSTDPLEQVSAAREQAFDKGSFIAGAKLVDMELKLIAAREADSKAREAAELDQMSPDELASMIRDTLASLPDELREQVLAPGGVVVPIDSARGTG